MNNFPKSIAILLVGAALSLSSCATPPSTLKLAQDDYNQGHPEAALVRLKEARAAEPDNMEIRTAYLSTRERAINDLVAEANNTSFSGNTATRTQLYQRILAIDPNSTQGKAGLEKLARDQERANTLLAAQFAFDRKDYEGTKQELKLVLAEEPNNESAREMMTKVDAKLNPPIVQSIADSMLKKSISIQFRDATLQQVFEILAKTSGINFVLDRDLKPDQKVTLFVHDMTVGDALDVILLTNQLEQRTLEHNAILIYQNTPAKQKDYQSLRVRTFFLANADAESVAASLKTLVKTKDIVIDKTENMIMMRDTPDAILMAEKIVNLEDLPESEVMLDLEVLEVSRERLTQLGVQFPQQLSLSPLPSGTNTNVTLSDLLHLTAGGTSAAIDPLKINLQGTDTDVRLLANPRIRVKNREDAKILIGDRVPNITSTSTSTGFVAENIQYLDVGLKLDVTPVISIDNEISIKVALEVSSIANQITTPSGTLAYQIGTRSANTVLRLRDGENQVLAGLINDSDHFTKNKVPGLGDLPIAGRLFSDTDSDRSKTEIVLSITPRLIRNIPRPQLEALDFAGGTETSMHNAGSGSAAVASTVGAPASPPAPSAGSAPNTPPGFGQSNGSSPTAMPNGDSPVGSTGNGAPVQAPGVIGGAAVPGALIWQGPIQAAPGSTFQEQLVLNAPQPLTGISYTLGYDPSVLAVVSVADGTLFTQNAVPDSFAQKVDAATGRIFVTVSFPSSGAASTIANSPNGAAPSVTGSGTLAVVTFKVIGTSGTTSLQVINVAPTGLNPGATVPAPASQAITITSR